MQYWRSFSEQTAIFMCPGSGGQPAANLVFLVEKKFTVRSRLNKHNIQQQQQQKKTFSYSLVAFSSETAMIAKNKVRKTYFSQEGRLSMV